MSRAGYVGQEMSMDLGKAILEDYWLGCKLKPERGLVLVSRAECVGQELSMDLGKATLED